MEDGACGQIGHLIVMKHAKFIEKTMDSDSSLKLDQGSAIIQNQTFLVKHVQSMAHLRMKSENFLVAKNFAQAST